MRRRGRRKAIRRCWSMDVAGTMFFNAAGEVLGGQLRGPRGGRIARVCLGMATGTRTRLVAER